MQAATLSNICTKPWLVLVNFHPEPRLLDFVHLRVKHAMPSVLVCTGSQLSIAPTGRHEEKQYVDRQTIMYAGTLLYSY